MRARFSLRLRLLVAVGITTLVALTLADVVVFSSIRSYLYNQVDNTLATSTRSVAVAASKPGGLLSRGVGFVPLDRPPTGDGGPGLGGNGPGGPAPAGSAFCAIGRESAPGMFIEVLDAQNAVVNGAAGSEKCAAFQPGSTTFSPKLPVSVTQLASLGSGSNGSSALLTVGSTSANGPSFRVRITRIGNGATLVLAAPISNITSTLGQLLLVEILVTVAALVAAALVGLWLVRVGLRPLRDVEQTAGAIAGGDLMHRVPNANSRTEVGRLATALNVMLERIEGLFGDLRFSESRLRRFVGDASHELRTPIAAVSAYAQLFHEGAADRPEDLERVMNGIERESARMGTLVEDLLTLAKLDEHPVVADEPAEIVGLVLESIDTARLVGPQWPVTFVAGDVIEIPGDPSALRQVVDNLLANVRAHTPEGTEVTVTVERSGTEAVIEVADNGPGFTADDARLVFERFFRSDPSRARSTGGAGLGLAIVAAIVEAHGGRAVALPRAGGGATFRVSLPVIVAAPVGD